MRIASPSSRGLGHHPFTVATGVRIPVGTPLITNNEDPADNRVFFVHRLPAFSLWRCGPPVLVAAVEPERKKFKKDFHKREHAGMISGSVTRGHSSAGRAPAWHAGALPAELWPHVAEERNNSLAPGGWQAFVALFFTHAARQIPVAVATRCRRSAPPGSGIDPAHHARGRRRPAAKARCACAAVRPSVARCPAGGPVRCRARCPCPASDDH